MKRVIVTGSGGRLGAALCRKLAARFDVTGLDRRALDLAAPDSVAQLEEHEFDDLINCAALTNVDWCEAHPGEARRVNAEAVAEMADIARRKGARLIQVSTDYVFDGEKHEPYAEADEPAPISVYGASKRDGELAALAASPRNIVVRVSWVFGPDRPSFPDMILKRAMENDRAEAVADKVSTPSYTLDLCDDFAALLEAGGAAGIYHLCNAGVCSWQEYGQCVLDCAGEAGLPLKTRKVGAIAMKDLTGFVARRPVQTALRTERFRELTGRSPRDWREAVGDYVRNHAAPALTARSASPPR